MERKAEEIKKLVRDGCAKVVTQGTSREKPGTGKKEII
jgi:hypothetical protein